MPPYPEPEGPELRAELTAQGIDIALHILRLKAFEKASATGVAVNDVDDPRAKRAREADAATGKEMYCGHGRAE